MSKKVDELIAQMQEKWQEIKAIRDLVVEEDREFKQDERDKIEKTLDDVRAIELQIEEERKNDDLLDQIDQMGAGIEAHRKNVQPRGGNGRQPGVKSIGQQFVESPVWKAFLQQVAPGGRIPESLKGISSPPVEIQNILASVFGRKDLITGSSDTSAGAFITADDSGIYEPIGRYPLTLRDLISVRQTTSDLVEFVRQTSQVAQATPVPEANVTDYTGATGQVSGEKPEGAMAFERVATAVKTIAVWIPATKRALADVPQMRGLIDQELREDVNEKLENQLLNGDGIGENFTGLANTAGVLMQAWNTDIVVTARQAITNLLINGRQMPTAYLFNPQDWESYDLLQDTNGRYYWGGPQAQGPRTLWGVAVAQSFLQTQGTGWLGNWRKMVLWDRMASTLSVSDSHADFFIRNMVAILCELRAAMGVIRPSAFVEIDLTSGS